MIFSSELLNNQEIKNSTPKNKLDINSNFLLESLNDILYEDALFESIMDSININEGLLSSAILLGSKSIYNNYAKNKLDTSNNSSTLNNIKNFDFSLSNIISKLIEGFIKILVKIFREFEVLCMNILLDKNSQIFRFKNKIALLGEQIEYSEPYYNYTNIRNSTSYTDIETSFRKDYNDLIQVLSKIDHLTESEIDLEMSKLNYNSNYEEYDELRGNLLGTNTLIREDEFATECFKYFRNNMSEPFVYGYIDPNDLHKRLNTWTIGDKTIKLCKKDKDKMEKAGRKLISDFKSIKLSKYSSMSVNRSNFIKNIISNYIYKTKNICNIYLIYFSSKLDAAKEELISNKLILFEACKYIVREGL